MDIFSGNKQLETAVFTGIDMALFSRHALTDAMLPFLLVYKDMHITHHIVCAGEEPNAFLDTAAKEMQGTFDQLVLCFEGKVSGGDDRKHDALLVKAFDASMPKGLLIGQRFVPLESGEPFFRLGRPALLDNDIPLPIPVVAREITRPEAPYLSDLIVSEEDGTRRRVIIAGHNNASMLANELKIYARETLKEADSTFSGKMEIKFVPGSFTAGQFENWLFNELITRIKTEPAVTKWERANKKQLQITLTFNDAVA